MYIYRRTCYYMHIIWALGLRGLFFCRTPMEHDAHPTLEITVLEDKCASFYCSTPLDGNI
jgi:hypothetical protein